MSTSKLRILCLHGFTSNAAVHAHQLRRLTSLLPEYDFLFPDGPHTVTAAEQLNLSSSADAAWSELVHSLGPSAGHRAWWFAKESDYEGLDKSLEFIGRYMHERGPIHGIWGFSQGACLAGVLTSLLQSKSSAHPLRRCFPEGFVAAPPASAVIFSGFRARFPQFDSLYESGIDVPVLHVLGKQDPLVVSERSEALIRVCRNERVLKHDGGHDIPKKDEHLQCIVDFVQSYSTRDSHTIQASI